MAIKQLNSHAELREVLKDNAKAFLLLYKSGSEVSECALKSITEAVEKEEDTLILLADVATVRDIHPNYNVTSAPSVLVFENGEFKNIVKGCNDESYYSSLFKNAFFTSEIQGEEGKRQKQVTVYSTPTCSWCTTLKNYLNDKKIRYSDVDVSGDHRAAQEMVRKSGQQGVPQTEIDGEMIVGFDKKRINKLLDIE